MRPLFIKLRGFIGFKDGLGLEEVELDLRNLPKGIIAVVGENGMGKTTLLDNLHPYRIMPYKLREAKEWSPGAFSYYDHCYGRDAYKELIFAVGDETYRSVIFIDAEKRKQEAYLYREGAEGAWIPFNDAVKDGKTKEYDNAVEELCGSPTLFFSSNFRSQDARKISSYPRSEITSIISELLNIQNIKEQGEKANKTASALLALSSDLEQRKSALVSLLASRAELETHHRDITDEISGMEKSIALCHKDMADKESSIRDLELANAAQEVTRRRVEDMRTQLTAIDSDLKDLDAQISSHKSETDAAMARLKNDLKQILTSASNEQGALESELERERKSVTSELESLSAKRQQAESILARTAEINAAVDRDAELSEQIATERRKLDEMRIKLEAINIEIAELRSVDKELESAQSQLRQLLDQTEGLKGLDCHEDGKGAVNKKCHLLVFAVAAEQQMPGVEQKIKMLEAKKSVLPGKRDEAEGLKKAGVALSCEITRAEEELKEVRKLAQLVFELDNAASRIEELAQMEQASRERLERRILETNIKIDNIKASVETKRADINNQLQETESKFDKAQKQMGVKRESLSSKSNSLNDEIRRIESSLAGNTEEEIAAIRKAMNDLQNSIASRESDLKALHARLGSVNAQLDEMDIKSTELESIESEIRKIGEEIGYWKLLAKACSNDGIIALEIEDAGPAISATTNDLLHACYGPRFSVRLETQGQKANGDKKEIFDITVFDSERNTEKSLWDMSGGEVTYIEDAITRAFSQHNQKREGLICSSMFSDEKDGALSPKRKCEFLAIKRRALEIGNHEREFFITQTMELVDSVDAKIVLGEGKVTVHGSKNQPFV